MSWSSACTPSEAVSLHQLPGPCKQIWINRWALQGRGRGRLGYVLLAALGAVLLAPFYGGMWLYYTHAKYGTDRMALVNVSGNVFEL